MPSLQILSHALDRRFCTPARLSAVAGAGAKHKSASSLIGPDAEEADFNTAIENQKRYIDHAVEKIESILSGRMLYRQRYRSRQPGTAMPEIALPQWPVAAEGLEVYGLGKDQYRINDANRRFLYRSNGWPMMAWPSDFTMQPIAGTEADSFRIDFWAGYLMPGQLSAWAADRAYITGSSTSVGAPPLPLFGSWVKPSDPTNKLRFECTTAGTSGASEPTWPTIAPWEPETSYSTGAWVVPTDVPIGLWYEATSGGTSSDETGEPSWPLEVGETVNDGTVVWTAREELTFTEGPDTLEWTGHLVDELPIRLQDLTAILAIELAKQSLGVECEEKDAEKCAKNFAMSLRFAA